MFSRPMWILLVSLFVGACRPVPSFTLTDADRRAVTSEVTTTLNELTEAINSHETERVAAFYTEDPEFLFLGCTSPLTGGARFKQVVVPTYGPTRGATFEQRVVAVQVLAPTAAVALQRGRSTNAPALFWTRVLVKQDGRWVITYEHQSWPDCAPPPAPHPQTTPSDSARLRPRGSGR